MVLIWEWLALLLGIMQVYGWLSFMWYLYKEECHSLDELNEHWTQEKFLEGLFGCVLSFLLLPPIFILLTGLSLAVFPLTGSAFNYDFASHPEEYRELLSYLGTSHPRFKFQDRVQQANRRFAGEYLRRCLGDSLEASNVLFVREGERPLDMLTFATHEIRDKWKQRAWETLEQKDSESKKKDKDKRERAMYWESMWEIKLDYGWLCYLSTMMFHWVGIPFWVIYSVFCLLFPLLNLCLVPFAAIPLLPKVLSLIHSVTFLSTLLLLGPTQLFYSGALMFLERFNIAPTRLMVKRILQVCYSFNNFLGSIFTFNRTGSLSSLQR